MLINLKLTDILGAVADWLIITAAAEALMSAQPRNGCCTDGRTCWLSLWDGFKSLDKSKEEEAVLCFLRSGDCGNRLELD